MKQKSSRAAARCHLAATLVALGVALLASTGARAEAKRYEIDPDHLVVGFLVDHVGFAKVLGMFRKATGSFTFDEETAALSDVRITITTDSVFTNHKKRDEHLRSADFLNSAEFPEMSFVASEAHRSAERSFTLPGQLTLLGKTQPLSLDVKWNKSDVTPVGGGFFGGKPYVMGVSARGSFRRSAFGMNYAVSNGWVGDEVELIIEFEAQRQ